MLKLVKLKKSAPKRDRANTLKEDLGLPQVGLVSHSRTYAHKVRLDFKNTDKFRNGSYEVC